MMLHSLALEDLNINHILPQIMMSPHSGVKQNNYFVRWLSKTLVKRLLEQ